MEHVLRRIGKQGDVEHRWEVGTDDGRIQEAESTFNEMLKKGGLAFGFNAPGGEGRQLDAFDPGVKEIVVFPRIAGG